MTHAPDLDGAFGWVDDYLAHVRPLFEVRAEDDLLIVLPNRAVKLNRSGLAILSFLKRGGGVEDLLRRVADDRARRRDLFYFLCDFRSLMTGCLGEGRGRKAVRVVPHPETFNRLPVLSEVALTYRCNLRCRFCYAACGCHGPGAEGEGEMTAEQVVRVLEVIRRDAKVPSVSFTGGEPLLRGDLELLTAAAVRIGLRVNLITNGSLLAGTGRARRLREAGLSS
ncbi:MAG TPA: radical SAM protein, partial [Phycisphaerae bacterium]|nr:radical SAM protein [Phycisphaerae bacterium]